jgi:hypothetical protein
MRYFAVLISLCLVGCGALLEATNPDRENRYNAAVSSCGQMQSDPVRWAQCQTEAEKLNWGWGAISNRDLLSERQARRAEIASRLARHQITLDQANVELSIMQNQIANETDKRQADTQNAVAAPESR